MKPLPDPNLPWPIAMAGVYEIANSEGLRLKAYKCFAGKWTCGWGETDGVGPTTRWTKEYADGRFCDSLAERTEAARALCTRAPTENELAAFVSLTYNIGIEGFRKSTVLRQHNAGNSQAAARAFALWNKARNANSGQLEVVPGLTSRRAREAALYLTPDDPEIPVAMPQEVEPESSLARSPINGSAAATVGIGAVTGAGSVVEQLQEASGVAAALKGAAQQAADFVGLPPAALLALALIVIGLAVMRQRAKQRSEGWA